MSVIISDDYWPEMLNDFANEDPLAGDDIVVAEISKPWSAESYKHLFTALVPLNKLKIILECTGGIGTNIENSGPHPSSYQNKYNYHPFFKIWCGDIIKKGLEPLIVSWKTGSWTVLHPDQGFLMTYGLVPRQVKLDNEFGQIHWDDPDIPTHSVVIVEPKSEYSYELKSEALVKIKKTYLEDYATVRNRALIQVYFVSDRSEKTKEYTKLLEDKKSLNINLPGRQINISDNSYSNPSILCEVSGVRLLLKPGRARISNSWDEYGELEWPGIEEKITRKKALRVGMKCVYINDKVLGEYEGKNDYRISPESGSVGYEGQWSVSYTRRVGRDLIQAELKKIYEGVPPNVVKIWHKYAVNPPRLDKKLRGAKNVAVRAKRIVYALLDLGDVLSLISKKLFFSHSPAKEIIKLDRKDIEYFGWYNDKNILPITYHIPIDMTESQFLERCVNLNKLIIEGINEGFLRKIINDLGLNDNKIRKSHSINLLETLSQLIKISKESGLDLSQDKDEIIKRWRVQKPKCDVPAKDLHIINKLRQCKSHRDIPFTESLNVLDVSNDSIADGFGLFMDKLYDKVGDSLENTIEIVDLS